MLDRRVSDRMFSRAYQNEPSLTGSDRQRADADTHDARQRREISCFALAGRSRIGQCGAVTHLDHLTIFVRDHRLSAQWYVENLGFEVEFETPDAATTAIRDDRDFTVFLTERATTDDESRVHSVLRGRRR
jgi:hypothetical protein